MQEIKTKITDQEKITRSNGDLKCRDPIVAEVKYAEHQNAQDYGVELTRIAVENDIDLKPDNHSLASEVIDGLVHLSKQTTLPRSVKLSDNEQVKKAGMFYQRAIRPMMATGKDAYTPTNQDIHEFCHSLAAGEEVRLVFYYALSKTKSPARTGSPDVLIDFAELEMLKLHAEITGAAQVLGFNFKTVLVDETPIIPRDNYMGFSDEETQVNDRVAQDYLRLYGAEDRVIIRSITESVEKPLGDSYGGLYLGAKKSALDQLTDEINQNGWTAGTIRMRVLMDCMPDEGFQELGLGEEQIADIRNNLNKLNLNDLDQGLLQYLVGVTTHISAVMSLRNEAEQAVHDSGDITDYPEYGNGGKVYGGVTRSSRRWSFVPHPVRWNGKTVNPMHGIAVYNKKMNYNGVAQIADLKSGKNEGKYTIITTSTNKPVLALENE